MKRDTLLLVGGIALLVMIAYGLFAFAPLVKKYQVAHRVLTAKVQELAAVRDLVAHYDDYRERAVRIQIDAQRLEARVPERPQIPELLKEITRAAAECNIREFQFVPLPQAAKAGYSELPVRLKLLCHYHALGLFITRLAMLPRLATVTSLKIKGKDKTGKTESITAEMTLVTYVLTQP